MKENVLLLQEITFSEKIKNKIISRVKYKIMNMDYKTHEQIKFTTPFVFIENDFVDFRILDTEKIEQILNVWTGLKGIEFENDVTQCDTRAVNNFYDLKKSIYEADNIIIKHFTCDNVEKIPFYNLLEHYQDKKITAIRDYTEYEFIGKEQKKNEMHKM